MGEKEERSTPAPSTSAPRRRSKYIFAILLVVACGLVYLNQLREPGLSKDWPQGLKERLQQAKREDRRVLAFFVAYPPGEQTRRMIRTTLRKQKNHEAIRDGKFLRVREQLDPGLTSELATEYHISVLPTMLLLDSDGTELNRREGFIGEVDFRTEFLTCKQVHKAGQARE
jgi:hypothetical protein